MYKEVTLSGRRLILQCVCLSRGLNELHDLVMRRSGGGGHLPQPFVQQRGYVPVKSHHKPGHGHARPNRPDPEVSRLLWSCCQKDSKRHPLYVPPLPHWAQARWCLGPSSSQKQRPFSVHAAGFAARACLQIIRDSSGQGLLLPEVSLKMEWPDGRLSSAHQQASHGGKEKGKKEKEDCSFWDGKKSNILQGAIRLVLELLWSAF